MYTVQPNSPSLYDSREYLSVAKICFFRIEWEGGESSSAMGADQRQRMGL